MMGYLPDHSRSVGAADAEADGALPASRITQSWLDEHGIAEKVSFIRWMIRLGLISADEWHHTGARFRRTPYWRPEALKKELEVADTDCARRFYALPVGERPRTADDWDKLRAQAVFGRPHPLWKSASAA